MSASVVENETAACHPPISRRVPAISKRLERLCAVCGDDPRRRIGEAPKRRRILPVRYGGAGVVGGVHQPVVARVSIRDGDVVGRSRAIDFLQPTQVEVGRVHAGGADREVSSEIALEGERPLVGFRLRLVRVDFRVGDTRRCPGSPRRSVRIEVHLARCRSRGCRSDRATSRWSAASCSWRRA